MIYPVGWKYRVVQAFNELEDGYNFTIREVFHDQIGKPLYYSEETLPYGNTRMELQEDLLKMINALIYPVIGEWEFDET